jgi:hypothetical protein
VGKPFHNYQTKIWVLKFEDSNTSKPNLNWSQTKVNLNKLFEYFSNLELFKISLNIQIQTKALNRGFLK